MPLAFRRTADAELASALGRRLGREPSKIAVAECLAAAAAAAAEATAPRDVLQTIAYILPMTALIIVLYLWGASTDEEDDGGEKKPAELLALFSNPALPREAARFGLRPLAFGQDLKLLLHALPSSEIDVEPAATLLSAQQALVRSSPRFLLFSGHTILEVRHHKSYGTLALPADRPCQLVPVCWSLFAEPAADRGLSPSLVAGARF